jgi:protein-tyrosine-phosphatase
MQKTLKRKKGYLKKKKYTKKVKNILRKSKKYSKKAGMNLKNFIAPVLLSQIGQACGNKNIMTACAGNTCRSPLAQEQLKHLLGTDYEGLVTSRGLTIRNPGAPMAPYTEQFAQEYCKYGDLKCIEDIKSHKSTPLECDEIKGLISKDDDTLQIIPMDSMVANNIKQKLDTCNLTPEQRMKINVGLDCNNGVCNETDANVPDPFFDRGTDREKASYEQMQKRVAEVLEKEFNKCSTQPVYYNDQNKYTMPNLK